MFFKISVLTNLANFPEKNLCWSLFLINLQAWRPTILLKRDFNTACNFIKKRHQHRYFPAKFSILLRTPFFTKHHWWVLLKIHFKIQGIITQTFKLLLNKKKKKKACDVFHNSGALVNFSRFIKINTLPHILSIFL